MPLPQPEDGGGDGQKQTPGADGLPQRQGVEGMGIENRQI